MADRLKGTVGVQAANAPADVRTVQRLLAPRMAMLGLPKLGASGACDEETVRAIRTYQVRVLGDHRASGRVHPDDRMMTLLGDRDPAARQREEVRAGRARQQLSGANWWQQNGARFADSTDTVSLMPAFAASVDAFVAALERAGAYVSISATKRSAELAWVMRTAGDIARNTIEPHQVEPDPTVGILWNHGDPQRSQDAAEEMVQMFGGVEAPAIDSPELTGTAIAMDVRWYAPIAVRDAWGAVVPLDRPRLGARCPDLHRVGRSYGVVKTPFDPLRWVAGRA